jgi:hypothetical protein
VKNNRQSLLNLNPFKRRIIQVPETNATKPVEAVQLWFVRWKSGSSVHVGYPQVEGEAFTSEEEAIAFRDSLVSALRLLRYRKDGRDRDCPYNITITAQTKDDEIQ